MSDGPAKPLHVPPVEAMVLIVPVGVPRKMPEPPAINDAPNEQTPELLTATAPLNPLKVTPVEAIVVSAPPAPMKMPSALGVMPRNPTVLPWLISGKAPKLVKFWMPPVAAMVVTAVPSLAKMPTPPPAPTVRAAKNAVFVDEGLIDPPIGPGGKLKLLKVVPVCA